MNTTIAIKNAIPESRIKKLVQELNFAINKTDKKALTKWGIGSACLFLSALKRRGFGFLNTVKRLVGGIAKESVKVAIASKEGKFREHIGDIAVDASIALVETKNKIASNIKTIASRLKNEPAKAGTELFVAILGFYLGSGGLDGDGGIPDLDLKMGIGTHRSIWFHSIIPGATIETAVFSLASLVNSVHGNLPRIHDELWDRLLTEYNRLSIAFASGTCAGLAYHLMIDATWDAGKAYSNLPFSTPMEGHQVIMGTNSAIEWIDIGKKTGLQSSESEDLESQK